MFGLHLHFGLSSQITYLYNHYECLFRVFKLLNEQGPLPVEIHFLCPSPLSLCFEQL